LLGLDASEGKRVFESSGSSTSTVSGSFEVAIGKEIVRYLA
jgi:hypothetical protein